MVARPYWSRASLARSTASRISFTPANTAEIAMNSALKAFAMRRARVVFPTPGGPHRIIECGLPARSATLSGLPSPRRCRWPTTSSTVAGRNRSARGHVDLAGCGEEIAGLAHAAILSRRDNGRAWT
jgi:hypothetical protein